MKKVDVNLHVFQSFLKQGKDGREIQLRENEV